jgi:phosphotransferase system enzyme I (PtsP)
MGPAALLDYDRKRLRGLVLEEGGPTSHVSIVARALGIPTVGEIDNATGLVETGDAIIVDGSTGHIHMRPPQDIQASYGERVKLRARRQAQYRSLRERPCITKDGQKITLMINAGLTIDLPHIEDTGAAGIGLFRTELQFMVADTLPRTGEQLALYRAVLDAAGKKPVTFRTLDIGGDKVLPYMRNVEEENPALGWRAIRLGLDRPGLLRSQVRALLRAAGGRSLKLMFPMIAVVEEFDKAKSLVEIELTHLRRHGHELPERVEIGTMLEVPSLLFQLNDLMQFLYAADRGNPRVSERFDPLSAPVLRALKDIVDTAKKHNKPVTLCGELASQPVGALALIILGYRTLSLTPSAVGPVKALLLELDCRKGEEMLLPCLAQPVGSVSIRHRLESFAATEGLQL